MALDPMTSKSDAVASKSKSMANKSNTVLANSLGLPPFTIDLLEGLPSGCFSDWLPATIRSCESDVVGVRSADGLLLDVLEGELSVARLNVIQSLLWLAGRPMPARPLTQQLVMNRQIIVTEEIGLHLVWRDERIYLKPLPKFLLDADLWTHQFGDPGDDQGVRDLDGCARGLLHSYCCLVSRESDLLVAHDYALIPKNISWSAWQKWTSQVLENCPYPSLNPRYLYGELRLGRLNKIYRLRLGHVIRGYSTVGGPADYSAWLSKNFALVTAILGYLIIVLTALQVGLATEYLQQTPAFQNASWILTLIALFAPAVAAVLILVYLMFMIAWNWRATTVFERKRSRWTGIDIRSGKLSTEIDVRSGKLSERQV